MEPSPSIDRGRDGWRRRLGDLTDQLPLEHPRLAGAVLAAVLLIGLGWFALQPDPPPIELTLPRATAETAAVSDPSEVDEEITVHAAGAVNAPGLYRLAGGSRVADLLAAAGGATADADLDQLNLAAPLADGERVLVSRRGEIPPTGAEAGKPTIAQKLDINTATAAQLDELPGVGPATAEAIIRYRETNGRFRSVTQLLEVRGIGEAKLAQLRPLVKV